MNKKEKKKMINTYDSYVEESGAITIEQMRKMHENMMLEIGEDEDALELYDDLCNAIFPYADLRAKWHTFSIEEKMDKDSFRTACHDNVILHFNMIARYLKMQGKEVQWREQLGDEKADKVVRKGIGDFGCYIIFVNSICAR